VLSPRSPRIGLDLTYLAPERTGLGTYGLNLVAGLAQHDRRTSYVLFVSRMGRPHLPPLPENFTVVPIPIPYRARFGMEQLLAPLFMSQRLDVLHSTSSVLPLLYAGKTITTVHDITYIRAPETMTPKSRLYFGALIPLSVKRATRVITVSHTVRDELCHHQRKLSHAKVMAIPEAINDRFFAPPVGEAAAADILRRYNVRKPYLLFVGTREPRKNLNLVLKAFARLRAAGLFRHKLVLVGRVGWLKSSLAEAVSYLNLEQEVIETGYVPDGDLPTLYRVADLFVFPSLYEGFGLPVIEAMACGTPVIASDIPVLREVAGDAAMFIDPRSVDDLSNAILSIVGDVSMRAGLIDRGRARAQEFTVRATSLATMDIYRRVAEQ